LVPIKALASADSRSRSNTFIESVPRWYVNNERPRRYGPAGLLDIDRIMRLLAEHLQQLSDVYR